MSLRHKSGEYITNTYEQITHQAFDHTNGIPVLICTHNEENDLPLTLLGLARSSVKVAPIIVDNSTDKTAEYATRMGAKVIHEAERGQMKAYQTGLSFVAAEYPGKPVIITDADIITQQRWIETLLRKTPFPLRGGVSFGRKAYEHGPNRRIDIFRTVYAAIGDTYRYLLLRLPRPRGVNCLIYLTDDILKSVLSQPPHVFPCDAILAEAILQGGGVSRSVLSLNALVFERNDRFTTIGSYISYHLPWGKTKEEYYEDHGFTKKINNS